MTIDASDWFSVQIVLERTIEGTLDTPLLVEERILPMRATTEDEVAQRAEQLARGRRETFSS